MTARGAPAHNRRVFTDAERQQPRAMRGDGASLKDISLALQCQWTKVRALVGQPAPRPPAGTPGGIRKKVRRERVRFGRGDDIRHAEDGFALPAGHALTWGAISSEPFVARSSVHD